MDEVVLQRNGSRVMVSVIVQRSDELEKVGKDMRAFMRQMKKELGKETDFDVQVGVNPHGHIIDDQRTDPRKEKQAIGFVTPPQTGDDAADGTQKNSEGRT